ncbi:IS4 family transposase (plasmid) [Photobacterium sp. DA100]|uniref:IS4 family transposase n=1 Tax=Photobacterium sp. DA100 TaxID=3027472 RepID=UPI00247852D6|nr:IS4 family transposase [Photobacterium sp. DA100]WEM41291.1 IS4 family transposase [Photobacterium sp. DA100]WEM42169.1 IS4 family transposase [Photobacterium sp. DA100]WEM43608.1 IS4 family transposase [Photobacterium sp. DA100]WEM45495.1 IS4 family transposase [Photobacterium sp. DA100]
MDKNTHEQWADMQFGQANLNDPRRTQRLVSLAASLAQQPGVAVSKLSLSPADMEGAYRFIRNDHIEPKDIAEAGFQVTAQRAATHPILLALEDTTALVFRHQSVKGELGHINQGDNNRAILAHSILLFAPQNHDIVGLIEQQMWTRDILKRGQRHQHASRPYKEKESYKWEKASQNMVERLGTNIDKVISVCDREADIYEYLAYKAQNNQRFVVRSMQSRCIKEHDNKLYDYAEQLQNATPKVLHIPQKGGRKARDVVLDIKYAKVTLKAPANKSSQPDTAMYYVSCVEQGDRKDKLAWHLLTSERVTKAEDAERIVSYYEHRWLIEDYHKVWKSEGTGVEELRMQSRDNLERISVILAFIATRLLQLRFMRKTCSQADHNCEKVLSTQAWKLLWLKMEKKTIPESPPNISWAYENLARMGGWKDTKRTGKASVKALWEGWFKLQTILEGYELAMSLDHQNL